MPLPLVNVQVRSCDTTCVPDCVPDWVPDWAPAWVPACVPACETSCVSDWVVGCAAVNTRLLASTAFWSAELFIAECGLDVALADEALAGGVDGDAGEGRKPELRAP